MSSDDLVKRLRNERDKARIAAANYAEFNHEWRRRAEQAEARADALTEQLAATKDKLAKAAAFIEFLDDNYRHVWGDTARSKIRALYAELTEGKTDE